MTDKWIGPRVLCGASIPPPDGYEYLITLESKWHLV